MRSTPKTPPGRSNRLRQQQLPRLALAASCMPDAAGAGRIGGTTRDDAAVRSEILFTGHLHSNRRPFPAVPADSDQNDNENDAVPLQCKSRSFCAVTT